MKTPAHIINDVNTDTIRYLSRLVIGGTSRNHARGI